MTMHCTENRLFPQVLGVMDALGKFPRLYRYQNRFPRSLAHYNNQKVS